MAKTPKIVEKLSAAATLANVPEDVAKRAKSLGCPAFKAGNRIDWKQLKVWCAENSDKLKIDGDNISLKDQKLNEEVRKLRRANDVAEGKLIASAVFESEIRQMAEACQGVLYSGIDSLAVATAGQTATVNHALITAKIDEAIAKLSRGEMK